jgi:hypothetical protein
MMNEFINSISRGPKETVFSAVLHTAGTSIAGRWHLKLYMVVHGIRIGHVKLYMVVPGIRIGYVKLCKGIPGIRIGHVKLCMVVPGIRIGHVKLCMGIPGVRIGHVKLCKGIPGAGIWEVEIYLGAFAVLRLYVEEYLPVPARITGFDVPQTSRKSGCFPD